MSGNQNANTDRDVSRASGRQFRLVDTQEWQAVYKDDRSALSEATDVSESNNAVVCQLEFHVGAPTYPKKT